MSACDELVGRPKYQVIRSQTIAPISPPKITPKRDDVDVDHPLADRLGDGGAEDERGDEVEERGPDHRLPGESTRVETTVAIEFAASWKPLMKSNDERDDDERDDDQQCDSTSAVLHDDAFEHVGDVLAAVGGVLEQVEDLLPLHDDDRVALLVEQSADGVLVRCGRPRSRAG